MYELKLNIPDATREALVVTANLRRKSIEEIASEWLAKQARVMLTHEQYRESIDYERSANGR